MTTTEATAPAVKVPPLIRAAKYVLAHGLAHVDNLTGCLVHSKKVERALMAMGLPADGPTEQDEIEGRDGPIVIQRKRGGKKINPVLLDATTASMIVKVWDAINEQNRAKLPVLVQRFTVIGVVERFWKLVK
jgi:hypothetical protein